MTSLRTYSGFRPTQFDCVGLNLPDQQDWYVAPCGLNRDSDPWVVSNWEAQLVILGGESDTVEIHRFGHWACGWYEILLIAPSRLAEGEAIASRLEDYAFLNEDDVSQRESDDEWESWGSYGAHDMRRMLVKYFGLQATTSWALDDISDETLYEFHHEHSTHGCEHDGHSANFDFIYIDERYTHFKCALERDTFAAWLRANRPRPHRAEPAVQASDGAQEA